MSGNITFYYEDDEAGDQPGTTYYKAVRYDYGSFYDPAFKYGPVGTVVEHPRFVTGSRAPSDYISVSVSAADCTGFEYMLDDLPSRLLVVEPIGETWVPDSGYLPNKRAVTALKVVDELPIHMAFGPNGVQVLNFIDWFDANSADMDVDEYVREKDTVEQWRCNSARDAASDATRRGVRSAAREAVHDEVYWAAHNTVRTRPAIDAASALVVRDLISKADFDILVEPMRFAGYDFEEEK